MKPTKIEIDVLAMATESKTAIIGLTARGLTPEQAVTHIVDAATRHPLVMRGICSLFLEQGQPPAVGSLKMLPAPAPPGISCRAVVVPHVVTDREPNVAI